LEVKECDERREIRKEVEEEVRESKKQKKGEVMRGMKKKEDDTRMFL